MFERANISCFYDIHEKYIDIYLGKQVFFFMFQVDWRLSLVELFLTEL